MKHLYSKNIIFNNIKYVVTKRFLNELYIKTNNVECHLCFDLISKTINECKNEIKMVDKFSSKKIDFQF